jgi:hypothetical protein
VRGVFRIRGWSRSSRLGAARRQDIRFTPGRQDLLRLQAPAPHPPDVVTVLHGRLERGDGDLEPVNLIPILGQLRSGRGTLLPGPSPEQGLDAAAIGGCVDAVCLVISLSLGGSFAALCGLIYSASP